MNKPNYILDAHAHLGQSSITVFNGTEEMLLEGMEKYNVAASIVLPHGIQDLEAVKVHDRIAKLMEDYPDRIYGMASLNPRLEEKVYRKEIYRCIKGLGFCGIKLDPGIHALPIDSQRAEIVFACARELGAPVMIHTGMGTFTNPIQAVPVALKYPELTIVLAHAGLVTFINKAILAAALCPNITLEFSWTTSVGLKAIIKKLGAERVMFGSDHIYNIPVEIAKVHCLDLSLEEQALIFAGNAKRVYGLN